MVSATPVVSTTTPVGCTAASTTTVSAASTVRRTTAETAATATMRGSSPTETAVVPGRASATLESALVSATICGGRREGVVRLILGRIVSATGLRTELAGLRIVPAGRLTLLIVVAHEALTLPIALPARRVPLPVTGMVGAEPWLTSDFAAMNLSASFNPNARLRS